MHEGDATHAMTLWQGSGSLQAIEDVLILRTLLASIELPEQFDAALRAYDEVRRPRTQRTVETSQATGIFVSGRAEGIGVHAERMREGLKSGGSLSIILILRGMKKIRWRR